MPTALSLKIVMDELETDDTDALIRLTGLSEPQIQRCKLLLAFPERYQKLSLDPNPKTRIPSNFWIELSPLLDLCKIHLATLYQNLGRYGIVDKLIEKYHAKRIKSVIHFRKIMEAFETSKGDSRKEVIRKIRSYILNVDLETREAFDVFTKDSRRIRGAIAACNDFVKQVIRLKIDYTIDRTELRRAFIRVRDFADKMLSKLEGTDAPPEDDN
jgi:hypothetical protein